MKKLSDTLMILAIASCIVAGIAFFVGVPGIGILMASLTIFLSGAGFFATIDGK